MPYLTSVRFAHSHGPETAGVPDTSQAPRWPLAIQRLFITRSLDTAESVSPNGTLFSSVSFQRFFRRATPMPQGQRT